MIKKIFIFAAIMTISSIIGFSVYQEANKSCKSKRIACHEKVTVFEQIYNKDKINLLKSKINKGDMSLSFSIEEAKYSPSQLFIHIKPNTIQAQIKDIFNLKSENSNSRLEVLVYENDKLDPGKKNDDAKKYAGYIVYDFYLENEKIYKIQIDFMDLKTQDINQNIECANKSLNSLQQPI